ncbi:MAG: hypothetical protein ACRDS1_15935 [Pseudonocardiaceae bacterium]
MKNPRPPGGGAGDSETVSKAARQSQDTATTSPPNQSTGEPETVRPVLRLWRTALARSKEESAARRERVLTNRDLADRLTLPPLRLSSPQHWSGWIPPRTLPEECCAHCARGSGSLACRGQAHLAGLNDSPIRRQLVEIASEAMARESGR